MSQPSKPRHQVPSCDDIAPDLTRLLEGWTRRTLTDPARAAELASMYQSLGFEVFVQSLVPSDFPEACSACALSVCASYVLLYTRPQTPKI